MCKLKSRLEQTRCNVCKYIAAPVMIVAALSSQLSYAEITQVSASNKPSNASLASNSISQISWRISQRSIIGGQATISSTIGNFFAADGTPLGSTTTQVQSSRLTQLSTTTLFVINESLTIPLSVVRAAQKSGSSQIIYQRTFIDSQDGMSGTASANFRITGGVIAEELVVKRIQMEFDDGRTGGIFASQTEFSASAFISYQGTGVLEYSWEIASPPSTKGNPIFFPLISRKQYILSGGQITLQSPNLPSTQIGNYLVRLKIYALNNRDSIPTIRYTINESRLNNSRQTVAKLIPNYPRPGALLKPATEFKWKAVSGASAYQLEIHTKPIHKINPLQIEQEQPLTGILIPATKTSIGIGEVSRSYLIPGDSYYWRVIAINENGQVIARSEFRKIRF